MPRARRELELARTVDVDRDLRTAEAGCLVERVVTWMPEGESEMSMVCISFIQQSPEVYFEISIDLAVCETRVLVRVQVEKVALFKVVSYFQNMYIQAHTGSLEKIGPSTTFLTMKELLPYNAPSIPPPQRAHTS
jgi:hypothetical protein